MRAGDAVAEGLARVQQYFLETTIQAHLFVLGQIMEQSGETLSSRTGTSTRSILRAGSAA